MEWEDDHGWRAGKDLEGDGRGLLQGTILQFAWRDREIKKKSYPDSI